MSGAEQRRDPRVATQQAVWVEGQDVRIEAQARNMSRSGMFVVAPSAPPPGASLQVEFDDPQEGPVRLTMEVVWRSSDAGIGQQLGLRVADAKDAGAFEKVVERLLSPGSRRP